ncbi:hypothetical protein DFJ73DRAFT_958680 [Zopfochytrium polystomum]|nr:hypothetical protein DFJ73DRAFT_958680 [Zopfochytrium polystomum]
MTVMVVVVLGTPSTEAATTTTTTATATATSKVAHRSPDSSPPTPKLLCAGDPSSVTETAATCCTRGPAQMGASPPPPQQQQQQQPLLSLCAPQVLPSERAHVVGDTHVVPANQEHHPHQQQQQQQQQQHPRLRTASSHHAFQPSLRNLFRRSSLAPLQQQQEPQRQAIPQNNRPTQPRGPPLHPATPRRRLSLASYFAAAPAPAAAADLGLLARRPAALPGGASATTTTTTATATTATAATAIPAAPRRSHTLPDLARPRVATALGGAAADAVLGSGLSELAPRGGTTRHSSSSSSSSSSSVFLQAGTSSSSPSIYAIHGAAVAPTDCKLPIGGGGGGGGSPLLDRWQNCLDCAESPTIAKQGGKVGGQGCGGDGVGLDGDDDDGCPICLEERVLKAIGPCAHSFCSPCIRKWESYAGSCPFCRAPIPNRRSLFRIFEKKHFSRRPE